MHVVFVAPFLMETTLRFIKGATLVPGVQVTLVSQQPAAAVPAEIRERLASHRQVENALDAAQLLSSIQQATASFGAPERVFGALEQLQVPLAEVRETLGLSGMTTTAAHNFRDKSRMKTVFQEAGIPCARHRLIGSAADAASFVTEVGFPVVVKPPAGAGARHTFRLENKTQLEEYLVTYRPKPDDPTLFEEFLTGREHSFDSVWIQGQPVWHSISRYYPTPLEVMENPWIQWCVVLPREIDGPEFEDIRASASAAHVALGVGTALTHLEWFRRDDGGIAISEVAARPPGAQFVTLISYAHDLNFYRAWPEIMIKESFAVPERRYACGAAFLRGQGKGTVKAIHGLDSLPKSLDGLVVESRIPKIGQPGSSSYEGEGYVILRHPDTSLVETGLAEIVRRIRVELG